MIKGIKHIAVAVRDLEVALRRYQAVLGVLDGMEPVPKGGQKPAATGHQSGGNNLRLPANLL